MPWLDRVLRGRIGDERPPPPEAGTSDGPRPARSLRACARSAPTLTSPSPFPAVVAPEQAATLTAPAARDPTPRATTTANVTRMAEPRPVCAHCAPRRV